MAREKDTMNDWQIAISIFSDIATHCFPYAFTFAFGSYLFRSALKMVFGGKVEL